MRRLLPMLVLAACAEGDPWTEYFDDGGTLLADAHANVIREFEFTAASEPGVGPGFDIDGLTSPDGDSESCGHGDLTDDEGREGIDNQLAAIWGVLEPLVGVQVQELLQGAINEGRFLLMIELTGVDDLQNDESVTVSLYTGEGDPEIGTFDLISPDQTFRISTEIPPSSVADVPLNDGWIEAGPVEFSVPINILEADFVMQVRQGRLRLQVHEDGTMSGLMGGAINVPDVINEILATDARQEAALVQPIFENNADMGFDGSACNDFSVAFGIEGTTAFVVHDVGE